MLGRRWKTRWTDPERRPNKKEPLYVSQNPEMKCRHPERDSGTALLKKSVFISVFISVFLMSDGSKNRISKFKVLYATSWWSCDSTVEHQKGRQELRLQSVVNKKTNSGTRLRSDPSCIAVNFVFFIFMSDGSRSYLRVWSFVCYVLRSRDSTVERQNGRQELGS